MFELPAFVWLIGRGFNILICICFELYEWQQSFEKSMMTWLYTFQIK
jgi:hypothetical protein